MSTNAQPRVLGRWCRTLVHARRAFVAPADATSASCDVRSRDDSGRQRPRVAPSADRNVHGLRQRAAQRQRAATSEWYVISEPQRQARNVKRATSSAQRQARNVKRATSSAQRQVRNVKRATSSAQRQARNVKCATSSAQRQQN